MESCPTEKATFQIILNEENDAIENHIFRKPACDLNSNKATLGIQNSDGFKGFAVPGYNATSWTADTMAWKYIPAPSPSVDSFEIVRIPYRMQPISPGDKISYRWYAGNEFISDQQSITVAPNQTTQYRAVCILCSGEEFSDDITVYIVPYIPNAFTPNGDGINDTFKILGLPPEKLTKFNIQIFNRWGEVIFTSNDIREAWDGTKNGLICPEGDYVWVIFYEDESKIRTTNKGTITLLR
jgi:gliding motility-associated-like protein